MYLDHLCTVGFVFRVRDPTSKFFGFRLSYDGVTDSVTIESVTDSVTIESLTDAVLSKDAREVHPSRRESIQPRTCHATDGPPISDPPGPCTAATGGPRGPSMAPQTVPLGPSVAPQVVPPCYNWSQARTQGGFRGFRFSDPPGPCTGFRGFRFPRFPETPPETWKLIIHKLS